MSVSILRFMSALMISPAARIALLIALRFEDPWALRMLPRSPSSGAPP
jgi:hypothetical protein